jgi:farnesyl-diphosphate farnesyltransferase
MLRAVPDRTLDEILSKVSRSFYLSLAILPRSMRAQLSAAYLVARAADTIADTELVRPPRRIELLDGMRAALADPARVPGYVAEVAEQLAGELSYAKDEKTAAERLLLTRLGDCLRRLAAGEPADRERARKVLETLITGMERDLRRFPDGRGEGGLVALDTVADLDEYTYMAAGCVGEYWTLMTAAHVPSVRRLQRPDFVARGVRLGKALQLINVIRDAAADLQQGRCYVPRELLARHQLAPGDLLDASARRRARPVLDELRRQALAHVDAAFPYVMAIPRREPRLRLAALWPLWIGLATLERLGAAADPLDPAQPVKVPRAEVYRILAESSLAIGLDPLLGRLHERRRARAAVR